MRRTKGWRKPEGTIVVARPSRWGNWYVVGTMRDLWPAFNGWQPTTDVVVYETRRHRWTGTCWGGFDSKPQAAAFAVDLYRRALDAAYVGRDGPLNQEFYLAGLAGHDLGCWCPLDQPCHADVLLDLANRSNP